MAGHGPIQLIEVVEHVGGAVSGENAAQHRHEVSPLRSLGPFIQRRQERGERLRRAAHDSDDGVGGRFPSLQISSDQSVPGGFELVERLVGGGESGCRGLGKPDPGLDKVRRIHHGRQQHA